jgi:REP element-mobilizing transposase RayT
MEQSKDTLLAIYNASLGTSLIFLTYSIMKTEISTLRFAMPRKARLDSPGTLHHVIMRGIEGKRIVKDNADCHKFINQMGTIALETETTIYAWALLTNHAHILLRSGPFGLPNYMRRLLTGYATFFNHRHRRHGHLFQNRYKSIVCEEDAYFKELLRYIHLNPLRTELVDTISDLNRYRFCGHSVILGRYRNEWQDRKYVLSWFGSKEDIALKAYRQFVSKGISQGRRDDLVGGGLIRSQGGWEAVKSMRRVGIREKSDERILGSGQFVEKLMREADPTRKKQFSIRERHNKAITMIKDVCKKENISYEALSSGGRRHKISKIRTRLAKILIEELGLTLTQTGHYLGVSASAITKAINRSNDSK